MSDSEELSNSAVLTSADFIEIINKDEQKIILDGLISRYTCEKNYSYTLWEDLVDSYSIRSEFAWDLFQDILKDREVIVFFERADDERMFLFKNGGQLTRVFENCYRFNFYITDRNLSFILSYNDHDYLIACGLAKEWFDIQ